MRKLKITELNRISIEEFKEAEKLPLVVVLDNIRSLHNIGSVFRTSDAFRVECIYLCGITATPPHPEMHKTALGAEFTVDWKYVDNCVEAVDNLKKEGYTVYSVEQAEGSIMLDELSLDRTKKYAVVMGNEVKGVQQEVIDHSDGCIEIPQYGTKHSLNVSVTAGIVSAKGRGISMGGDRSKIESFIQTDAAVNPGNSGGALVNTKGELVGINTAIYSETGNFAGYSFAVPISIAGKVANDLKQYGTVQRAILGVQIMSVGDIADMLGYPNLPAKQKEELSTLKSKIKVSEGACVADFADRSTAKEAGIEKGDVIVAVNGAKVKSANALQEQISKYRPGDKVQVTVDRNGSTKTFNVELRNAQGSTAVVKGAADSAEVLGAAFSALTNEQKRELGVSYGIEVTGLLNGKLKDAGIKKGFIIMVVNDQKISSPEQLEKIVDKVLKGNEDDRYIVVKGFYPNGRTKVYAIDLAE